jgi:hypothetical protein
MQRNFEPMRKQVEAWQRSELTDVTAKVVIYEAFVDGKLEPPNIWRGRFTICTSNRSMRNSGRERCGASRTRSLRRSRNSTQSRSSSRQPSWANSWRPGFHNHSSLRSGIGRPPLLIDERAGHYVQDRRVRRFESRCRLANGSARKSQSAGEVTPCTVLGSKSLPSRSARC